MSVKVGINGLGRIGKGVIRAWLESETKDFEIVMANDLMDAKTAAHILRYDSVHGTLPVPIEARERELVINQKPLFLSQQKHPKEIPWAEHGVQIVLECTGRFTKREEASQHLESSVKKVIISAPAKAQDMTVLMGINHQQYHPAKHHIISNASCTTNCVAPLAKVLHDRFRIRRAAMTTIHSYTNDQRILDTVHTDLRRARAGAVSMIPTTTGAAKMIGTILPELAGKIDGLAVRVPTPNVSLVDLVAEVEEATSIEKVNEALEQASKGPLKGILAISDQPLVSRDFNGDRHSAILDKLSTNVIAGHLVKVLAWYDNEVGFSHRMVELTALVARSL